MIARALAVLAAIAGLVQCTPTDSGQSASSWKADMESGTYAEWDLGGFGGHFDDGDAASIVDSTHAHSGSHSLEMTSNTTNGVAATRNFRWSLDARGTPLPKSATYTAWFFWDRVYRPKLFWNIMQWKTRTNDAGGNQPDWTINLYNNGSGMSLEWYDLHLKTTHKARTSFGSIQPDKWHEVKVTYTFDESNGSITSSLDGRRWFSISGVATQWPTTSTNPRYRHWSVNNYTNSNMPALSHLWVDDASIER
jgi:hypothetical protein